MQSMQLFKRILLSLFPTQTPGNNGMNPATIFVSFISSKEFFSVISRKIIENYKLNLFDISLDPFEFKIGFGENPAIKSKHIDIYYSYCSAANLNGYRFFHPSYLGNTITLALSPYLANIFKPYGSTYFVHFMYATYLLTFVFVAHIKKFPK